MALWGKTDAEASRPNWINLDNYPTGTELVFVDETEAQQDANKAKGIHGPGWWLFYSYEDSSSQTRYKTELVVALGETAENAGDDADDDIVVDTTITITEQPQDETVDSATAAAFAVDFTQTGDADVAIQWQYSEDAGTSWGNMTGETSFDLAVDPADPEFVDGYLFRAVLTGGGVTVTSDAATLTVTA